MKSHRFCLSAALFSLALFAVSCTKESLSEETILNPEKSIVKKSAEASYHQSDATDAPDTDSGADVIKKTAAVNLHQSDVTVTDDPSPVDPIKKTAEASFHKPNNGGAVSDSPFASTGKHFRPESAVSNVATSQSGRLYNGEKANWTEDKIIADPAYPKSSVMQTEKRTDERQ